eukprot:1158271-Pelagomonas_calceolata.AAC.15
MCHDHAWQQRGQKRIKTQNFTEGTLRKQVAAGVYIWVYNCALRGCPSNEGRCYSNQGPSHTPPRLTFSVSTFQSQVPSHTRPHLISSLPIPHLFSEYFPVSGSLTYSSTRRRSGEASPIMSSSIMQQLSLTTLNTQSRCMRSCTQHTIAQKTGGSEGGSEKGLKEGRQARGHADDVFKCACEHMYLLRHAKASSVKYAHKLVTTRLAIENKTTLHSQVLEPSPVIFQIPTSTSCSCFVVEGLTALLRQCASFYLDRCKESFLYFAFCATAHGRQCMGTRQQCLCCEFIAMHGRTCNHQTPSYGRIHMHTLKGTHVQCSGQQAAPE